MVKTKRCWQRCWFLKDNLREYKFSIFEASTDADTLIAKVDVQEARNGSDVVVHVDDVDILCLLMHHCKDVLGEVLFQTLKKTYESRQTWRIKGVNENVDECILGNILFWHAWSGCDTTSGPYGMGKIQNGNLCEGFIGCKQILLPLSRNAIVLSRSVLFFKQKCYFLSSSVPSFSTFKPPLTFKPPTGTWVFIYFSFCVFFVKDFYEILLLITY